MVSLGSPKFRLMNHVYVCINLDWRVDSVKENQIMLFHLGKSITSVLGIISVDHLHLTLVAMRQGGGGSAY